MQKAQLLSPADGKVVETLTDSRVLATIAGVTLGNAAEKQVLRAGRQLFGVAVPGTGGTVKYFPAKVDGTADTAAGESPTYRTNRNVARATGVVGAVAAIEFSNSGEVQYGLLGAASIWLCHVIQDLVPALR